MTKKKAKGSELQTAEQEDAGSLAVFADSDYSILDPGSEEREALSTNLEVAGGKIGMGDLVRVKFPAAGDTEWMVDDITGKHRTPTITGILAHVQACGQLWPSQEPGNDRPFLVTYDLKYARKFGDSPGDLDEDVIEQCLIPNPENKPGLDGVYDWTKLPYTEFGTGRDGGKRAKEGYLFFVLRPDDIFPIMIQIGPGSVKVASQKIVQLPAIYYRCVVDLSLTEETSRGGKDYAKLAMSCSSTISKEAGKAIRDTYTDRLRTVAASFVQTSNLAQTQEPASGEPVPAGAESGDLAF